MIDLHSHVLPGVDDGAAIFAESLAIARAAVEDGIAELAATPHVRADYPTSPATMLELVDELRMRIASEGIPLLIHTGGEISLDSLDRLTHEELRSFGLGGSRYLLLEFPYVGWPLDAHERLFRLQLDGFVPVIAHPERSAEVRAAPERLGPFVELGALVQVTAASLDGRFGAATQRTAHALVRGELAQLVASDAHSPGVRGIGMSDAARTLDGELARWLTESVPRAILRDETIPARPSAPGRRRWWRR